MSRYLKAKFSNQRTFPRGSISVLRYIVLLDTTRALAHIGVYILHITLSAYQVFGAVAGDKFTVDIEKQGN